MNASPRTIEIEYVYMDTKRVFNQNYIDQLVKLYGIKFKNRKYDAIVSSDDHAFRFLLRHHQQLFGETPVIFCGVNYFQDDMLLGKPQFTGVLESFDMLATINVALDLQPRAKRIIAISDQSVSGKANRKHFEKILHLLKRPLHTTVLDNHTMSEITSFVSDLSPDDILLWLVFTVDRNGTFYTFEESTRIISRYSPAPMYSFWDFNLGHGIVGGMLTSGTLQGEKAAELALRVIQGESVAKIPIIRKSPNQYMFDYLKLNQFGLNQSELPTDSIIINHPVTFYSENKTLFWSTAIIFCCMTAIIVALLFSIASRKKTEQALTASKDRYQSVFYSASVAMFEADFSAVYQEIHTLSADTGKHFRAYLDAHPEKMSLLVDLIRVKDVNPAAVLLFRAKDKAELINTLMQRILSDRSMVLREIMIGLAQKREYLVWEEEVKNLDNDSLHVIFSLNFPQQSQNYGTMVFSVFDITDRKLSEQALRRSEDRFRTVFNQAASGMALIDLDGTYLRINQALSNMLGYTESELLQRTWKEVTHTDDINSCMAHIDAVVYGQVPHPIEKRYIHKNGEVIHVLFNLAAIFSKSLEPVYFIAQLQDITQIKAAQAALSKRDERYRTFFEADLSGVYITKPEGELVMCNDVMAKILGYGNHREVIGTNLSDYYKDPAHRVKLIDHIKKYHRIKHFEIELVRKDGSEIQCQVNAIGSFDEQGNLAEIQGYLLDITHLKNLEAQLLHAQKMESIGTMAGGVAHDFNNLLMGVMGNTSLMLLEKEKGEPDYLRLKSIEQLVHNGSDLTRQLLGFAKGGKYEVRTMDLNKIVRRSIDVFARTHKQIEVYTDLSESLSFVEADRSQIDQVLYNLYLNAWHAMGDGGRLEIQTRNRHLDPPSAANYGLKPGDFAEIAVQDNGIGMDSKTQQRIFDPFFTTKERERGTGLGLASAYGIIQNHFGSITVKSSPDEGSCFTILLPASSKKEVKAAPDASHQLLGGTETILLIDDEHSVLEAVGDMLRHLGYTVDTASDGQSAITYFEKNHPKVDLIILDMVMPGMGGKEVFVRLKQIDPNAKVMLCSGYSAKAQTADFLNNGCQGFMQKPFSIIQLSKKIGQVFQRN